MQETWTHLFPEKLIRSQLSMRFNSSRSMLVDPGGWPLKIMLGASWDRDMWACRAELLRSQSARTDPICMSCRQFATMWADNDCTSPPTWPGRRPPRFAVDTGKPTLELVWRPYESVAGTSRTMTAGRDLHANRPVNGWDSRLVPNKITRRSRQQDFLIEMAPR